MQFPANFTRGISRNCDRWQRNSPRVLYQAVLALFPASHTQKQQSIAMETQTECPEWCTYLRSPFSLLENAKNSNFARQNVGNRTPRDAPSLLLASWTKATSRSALQQGSRSVSVLPQPASSPITDHWRTVNEGEPLGLLYRPTRPAFYGLGTANRGWSEAPH